jgi:hypothetical protein
MFHHLVLLIQGVHNRNNLISESMFKIITILQNVLNLLVIRFIQLCFSSSIMI